MLTITRAWSASGISGVVVVDTGVVVGFVVSSKTQKIAFKTCYIQRGFGQWLIVLNTDYS